MTPKLAFVSLWNSANPQVESGYGYSMRRQLQKRFEVIDLFPLALPGERLWFPLRAGYKLMGRYYHPMREPAILKVLARRIERLLRDVKPDIVFAPSSMPLTYVETELPTVYVTDQLFCDFLTKYIPRPAARFARLGNAQESRALAGVTRASFPSRWAAEGAARNYGADPAKIKVIPWGANLPREIAEEDVAAAIDSRPLDRAELVFLGVDWRRKGGPALVATVNELNRNGFPAHATIIGCDPPGLPPDRFTVHPYLDKRNPDHFARFVSIMMGANFLFLPSQADAFPQAFCEAAAFGLPAIGSTVGGIPDIVRDGETGFLRAPDAPAAQFAAPIRETLAAPARYREMARQARREHRERLNWDSFGERLNDMVAELA
jgi:glycosyltransferase involved in cell wall biosynthesis